MPHFINQKLRKGTEVETFNSEKLIPGNVRNNSTAYFMVLTRLKLSKSTWKKLWFISANKFQLKNFRCDFGANRLPWNFH